MLAYLRAPRRPIYFADQLRAILEGLGLAAPPRHSMRRATCT
jgi:hypothetical protein